MNERAEALQEAFERAPRAAQEQALALMSEEEREGFLIHRAYRKLLTDERYCKAVMESMAEVIYRELRGEDTNQ